MEAQLATKAADADLKYIWDASTSPATGRLASAEADIASLQSSTASTATTVAGHASTLGQHGSTLANVLGTTIPSFTTSTSLTPNNSVPNCYAVRTYVNNRQISLIHDIESNKSNTSQAVSAYAVSQYVDDNAGGGGSTLGQTPDMPYDGRDMSPNATTLNYSFNSYFEPYLNSLSDTGRQTFGDWPVYTVGSQPFYIDTRYDDAFKLLEWDDTGSLAPKSGNVFSLNATFFPESARSFPVQGGAYIKTAPVANTATWTNMYQITAKNETTTDTGAKVVSAMFAGEFQTGLSHPDYDPYTDYGLTATNPRSNVHANYPANDTDTKTHYLVQADMSNQNLKWTGTIAVPADVNTAVVLNVNKSVPDLNTDNGPSAVNSVGLPKTVGRGNKLLIKLHVTNISHPFNHQSFLFSPTVSDGTQGHLYSAYNLNEQIKGRALIGTREGTTMQSLSVTIYVEPMTVQIEPETMPSQITRYGSFESNSWGSSNPIAPFKDVALASHDTYNRSSLQVNNSMRDMAPFRHIPSPRAISDLRMSNSGASCPYGSGVANRLYGDLVTATAPAGTGNICGAGYSATGGTSTGRFYDWVYLHEVGHTVAFAKFYEPIDGSYSPEYSGRNFHYAGLLTHDTSRMWMQPVMYKVVTLSNNHNAFQFYHQVVENRDDGTKPFYYRKGTNAPDYKTESDKRYYYNNPATANLNQSYNTMVISSGGARMHVSLTYRKPTGVSANRTDGLTPLTPTEFSTDAQFRISTGEKRGTTLSLPTG